MPSFQNSPWTFNLTDWVTFPAIFVATQRYIPLSETRVSMIFIEPEGRNVCLKERNHMVDHRTWEFKYPLCSCPSVWNHYSASSFWNHSPIYISIYFKTQGFSQLYCVFCMIFLQTQNVIFFFTIRSNLMVSNHPKTVHLSALLTCNYKKPIYILLNFSYILNFIIFSAILH